MIEAGTKVILRYTGKLEDGTVFDSTEMHGDKPLEFVLGSHKLLPFLEAVVSEMSLGEKRTVNIPAREAYGLYDETLVEMVPESEFPDAYMLAIGQYILIETPEGYVRMKVKSIEDGMITFDLNHELAGHDLTFDLEIVDIPSASGSLIEQEQYAGGTCGCGCDVLKEQLGGHGHSHDHDHDHGHDGEGCCNA